MKICTQVDLNMLNNFFPYKMLLNLTVFEIFAKNCLLTPCSIFSNGGHVFRRIENSLSNFVHKTLRNNHAKFQNIWFSSFRGEDVWKSLRTDDDDGRKVIAIAHRPERSGELKIRSDFPLKSGGYQEFLKAKNNEIIEILKIMTVFQHSK